MNVLYDHQIFSFQNYGGASRYFHELISEIEKLGVSPAYNMYFSNNVYAKKLVSDTKPFFQNTNSRLANYLQFYANRYYGDKILKQKRFDIMHPTYYHPYFLNLIGDKPYVITVLDMIHEVYKDKYDELNNQTIRFKKKVIGKASGIIAISQNTKNDLIKYHNIDEKKIKVIYLASSLNKVNSSAPSIKVPDKYILYVGKRDTYKNFIFFVESIENILKKKNVSLVCLGGGGFSREEIKLFNKLKIERSITQYNFKNDNELKYFYENAEMHIVPSLYEGFGLTVLEAMYSSCPVVSSNTSSLPEVYGNAALTFDPTDSDSITNTVQKLLFNKSLRSELASNGKKQSKKFSWHKTASQTFDVYSSLTV